MLPNANDEWKRRRNHETPLVIINTYASSSNKIKGVGHISGSGPRPCSRTGGQSPTTTSTHLAILVNISRNYTIDSNTIFYINTIISHYLEW